MLKGKLDSLQEKVAWLLNRYSDARDNDKVLMIRYWDSFEGMAGVDFIPKAHFHKLTAGSSISRARATIQNDFRLFQASESVRQKRNKLSLEEKEKVVRQHAEAPAETITVYADESGKTDSKVIVASVWVLHPSEELKFLKDHIQWRDNRPKAKKEFHFKEVSPGSLESYKEFVDFIREHSSTLSFKAICVERRGIGNIEQTLVRLHTLLLRRGIDDEHKSGRAPLPRGLNYIKDAEREGGGDNLMLAEIQSAMSVFAEGKYHGELRLNAFQALDSAGSALIQAADLYAGSLNRVFNSTGNDGPKDHLARYFFDSLGAPKIPTHEVNDQDLTVLFSL